MQHKSLAHFDYKDDTNYINVAPLLIGVAAF